MIEIIDLVQNLPDGKKRKYLGSLFVKAITDFYNSNLNSDIDLNELVVRNFNQLLLDDAIVNDLKLFASDNLKQLSTEEINIQTISIKSLRSIITDYYNIKYESDIFEPRNYSIETECQITLHDFQERIRRKVINLIFNNQKRFLIHMPTGSGKTRTAAEIVLDFIRLSSSKALLNEKIKILWIAQSSELCFQAYETVKWIIEQKGTNNIYLGNFYENEQLPVDIEKKPAIIFCGIQKLLKNYKKDIWSKIKNENYLVVVDEAHRSVASQWVEALNFFVSNSSVYLLGLTATPGIGAGGDDSNYLLSTYYNSNKISITDSSYQELESPIEYLVQRKFLAKIKRIDIDSNIKVTEAVNGSIYEEFKFTKKTLTQLTASHTRNSSIINIIKDEVKRNKKILVFTCGVEHNKILKSILLDLEIISETIDQSTSNRGSIINRFKNGNLNVLLNYGVLTTGFDAPKTDVCIIARPISSIVMYSQMVGRILRGPENQGNDENTLYTIKDNLGHGDYDNLFNSFNKFYN
jgi:superfamily II DNA or RNA helicase